MCRFVSRLSSRRHPANETRQIIYKGNEPIQLSHLVTRPRHSIINQAFESKLRMPSSRPMNVGRLRFRIMLLLTRFRPMALG